MYRVLLCLFLLPCLSWGLRTEDPDVLLDISGLVSSKGYPVESHYITTADGYINQAFRIPFGKSGPGSKPRPPVILQHGLLDSSATWVLNIESECLPFILVEAGFDVWMTNSRGNRYAKNHTTLSVKSPEFWDFTWDDMAQYDLPAHLDYVIEVTGFPKVNWVGHSQGTTHFFAGILQDMQQQHKVNAFAGLGPVLTVNNQGNWLLSLLTRVHTAEIVSVFGANEFLVPSNFMQKLFPMFCTLTPSVCAKVIGMICGFDNGAFNSSRMAVVAAHEPGGTSTKNMIKWSQAIRTGIFQKFDYGAAENMKRYGQKSPPQYNIADLRGVSFPMYLVAGGKDLLADASDVSKLMPLLPESTVLDTVPEYAHLDFCWAMNASEKVYPNVLAFLRKTNAM